MTFHRFAVLALVSLLSACGGGSESPGDPVAQSRDAAGRGEEAAADRSGTASAPAAPAVDGLVLTEVPDPCSYLTTEDATELLGESAGPGRSADAGGWNCIYDVGDPRRRLVLDMQIARGLGVEDTQLARSLEYCEAEIVERIGDLGVDSALYRGTADHCDDDLSLWVATPAVFEGRPRPDAERPGRFHVHLSVVLSPPYDSADDTVAVLRGAAERALARLGG
jgi:hypothetical protein